MKKYILALGLASLLTGCLWDVDIKETTDGLKVNASQVQPAADPAPAPVPVTDPAPITNKDITPPIQQIVESDTSAPFQEEVHYPNASN